jgi:dolichol-phosphate mannosyltransferase
LLEEVLVDGEGAAHREQLLRLLLVQRWLQLDDDEVVAEAADRLSLREFCGLLPDQPPPAAELLAEARERLAGDPRGMETLRRLEVSGRRLWDGRLPVLSIISPVYGAEATVEELVHRILAEVEPLKEDFEIVLVDDGSRDRGWARIEECCRADPRVVGIKLSRNFGQHAAITAGLAHARGDWVVVMDCDLQDDPRYIPALYREALQGADVVYTVKERRAHGRWRNWSAGLFFRLWGWLSSEERADPRVGAYSLISRRVVEAYLELSDAHRHYLMLLRWLGFPSTAISIRHEPRFAGRSSYSLLALVRHAIDGVVSHSDRVLYLAIGVGFAFLVLSVLGIVYLVVAYVWYGFREGWTSTIVLILLTTSIILLAIGTAGIYIGKIFEQVKQRPLYLVDQVRASPEGPFRHVPGS